MARFEATSAAENHLHRFPRIARFPHVSDDFALQARSKRIWGVPVAVGLAPALRAKVEEPFGTSFEDGHPCRVLGRQNPKQNSCHHW
jgi:hypothetical protein